MKNLKKIFLICLLALMFLIIVPQVNAEKVDAPSWNEGDNWAMGTYEVDIAPLLNQYWEDLANGFGQDWSVKQSNEGSFSYCKVLEVGGVEGKSYKVSLDEGVTLKAKSNNTFFYGPENAGVGVLDLEMKTKSSGFAYFDLENFSLSYKKMEGTLSTEIFDKTSYLYNPHLDLYKTEEFDVSSDLDFTTEVTYNPPLDVFDFPIVEGENWTVESTENYTSDVEGNVKVNGESGSVSYTYENYRDVQIYFECTGKEDLTLGNSSAITAYRLEYVKTAPGGEFIPGGNGTIYYSPARGFIVKRDVPLNALPLEIEASENSKWIFSSVGG